MENTVTITVKGKHAVDFIRRWFPRFPELSELQTDGVFTSDAGISLDGTEADATVRFTLPVQSDPATSPQPSPSPQ